MANVSTRSSDIFFWIIHLFSFNISQKDNWKERKFLAIHSQSFLFLPMLKRVASPIAVLTTFLSWYIFFLFSRKCWRRHVPAERYASRASLFLLNRYVSESKREGKKTLPLWWMEWMCLLRDWYMSRAISTWAFHLLPRCRIYISALFPLVLHHFTSENRTRFKGENPTTWVFWGGKKKHAPSHLLYVGLLPYYFRLWRALVESTGL